MAPDPACSDAAAQEGQDPLLMVSEVHSEVPLKELQDSGARDADAKARSEEQPAVRVHQPIKWYNVFVLTVIHAWMLYSFTYMPFVRWQTWAWVLFLLHFSGFGVTGGAHRLWTHRSYKAKLPLRIVMMLGHAVAGMNSLYDWVRDHRVHHKFSETDADPHNAKRGFFFAHVGWLMVKKHPEVIRRGQQVDMSDIANDPVCAFDRKYHKELMYLLCFFLPIVIPVVCWNESWGGAVASCIARWVLGINAVWSVNSAAHMFGGHPFNKFISPGDNIWVAFFSMGEGWHNYHHVFPWDYKASEFGSLNTTMHLIGLSKRLGWAYDLKTAPPSLVRRVAIRYGDGTHPDWAAYAPEVPEEAARDASVVDSLPPPSLCKDKAA